MAWDSEYDIVCVGSGVGGLSGAITGAERGASVIVLEKFHLLGGVSSLSSGQLWPGPTHLSEAEGIKDDVRDAQAYMDHLSQGFSDPDLRKSYFAQCREAIRFFTDTIGMELQVVKGLPDYYYPVVQGSAAEGRFLEIKPFPAKKLGEWASKTMLSPFGKYYSYTTSNEYVSMQIRGGEDVGTCFKRHLAADERCAGAGLAASQTYAALKRGIELQVSTEVIELVVEDGRVTGVVARDSFSSTRRIRARLGVLLSTGGYDFRPDMVRSFDALPDAGRMTIPTITGDHIVMASKAGAIPFPARAPAQTPVFVGYQIPGEIIFGKPTSRLFTPGAPHSIIVNSKGLRFANDSFYPDVSVKVGRYDGQEDGMANWPAWLIFDQNFVDKYNLLPAFPGQPLPKGVAVQSDSVHELAEATGIAADGLEKTVERFNGFCKTGVDEDFGRGTVPWGRIMTGDFNLPYPNFAEISKAPFYAVKLQHVTVGVPTAGLPINPDGSVISAAGNVIPGLYATGNSAAFGDWGGGYNSGIAIMRGMLYGYYSSLHMTRSKAQKQ
ncbi:fumarate reductase/succinate dehydrogenase flavo protein-like protein [Lepidopterella palustris CBS 459.81]|uniref:Fumarate reductase/succinate dehydrogenase flavo protein-like protein n=1 Tax=Lepidopterella palustris CBS 459.81 TaxID=1314670 RepID=A0A8E2DXB8_9PEZI|nr:fumarate reductase/succinate dehydrogenase flavo protein-like protein [Lepidopterella palustris CBS 459.81]